MQVYHEGDNMGEVKINNNKNLQLVNYDKKFLNLSWDWLNDVEIKNLTMTPEFTKEQQLAFFKSLSKRDDYIIFGIEFNGIKIGVCGLKNIKDGKAEYWGYIGMKKYWGKGLGSQILDKIIEIATEKQIERLYLKVLTSNSRAINLYIKHNFNKTEYVNKFYIMEKEI